jgi:hypothetical protein
LRLPRNVPVKIAASGLPPEVITPTKANWDAPEKSRRDKTQASATVKCPATAIDPNATPAAPTEIPTPRESLFTDTPTFCLNPMGFGER